MVAEIASWPNPQAWNIGAATTVVPPAFHGIRSSIAASEPAAPPDRRAPFGVPVVPEVSSTVRPGRDGLLGPLAEPLLDQLVESVHARVGVLRVLDPGRAPR